MKCIAITADRHSRLPNRRNASWQRNVGKRDRMRSYTWRPRGCEGASHPGEDETKKDCQTVKSARRFKRRCKTEEDQRGGKRENLPQNTGSSGPRYSLGKYWLEQGKSEQALTKKRRYSGVLRCQRLRGIPQGREDTDRSGS